MATAATHLRRRAAPHLQDVGLTPLQVLDQLRDAVDPPLADGAVGQPGAHRGLVDVQVGIVGRLDDELSRNLVIAVHVLGAEVCCERLQLELGAGGESVLQLEDQLGVVPVVERKRP